MGHTVSFFLLPRDALRSELSALRSELEDSRHNWSSERAGLEEDKGTLLQQKEEISYLLSLAQENVAKVTPTASWAWLCSLCLTPFWLLCRPLLSGC